MGWLSGWQYRKSHVINNATGAGTNYQIKTTVFHRSVLQSLSTNLSNIFGSDVDTNGVIYAGDGNYGVYKSTNNGASFTKIFDIPPASNPYFPQHAGKVWTVFVDSRNYIFVSAWCTNKLYRSTDGGNSFSLVLSLPDHSYEDGFIIAMTEDNNGILYAAEYGSAGGNYYARVWKSTDGGANWSCIKTFQALHLHNIKCNPYNNWIYVDTGDGSAGDQDRVFRSKDGGQTWQKVIEYSEDQTRFMAIAFIGNTVFLGNDYSGAGNSDIWKFVDDGQNEPFTPIKVWENTEYADSFFSCATLDGILYFATGGMSSPVNGVVVKGINNGTSWIVIKSGTVNNHYNILTSHPERNGIILGCFNDGNIYRITNRQDLVPNDVAIAKCKADFGDIRFTDDDGVSLLDYWMEEKIDGYYAVFWVEVADDLGTNSATIYVYYGNPDATTTSNGAATFLYFNHFDESEDFTEEDGTWQLDTSNSVYKYVSGGAAQVQSWKDIGRSSNDGYRIKVRARAYPSQADFGVYARYIPGYAYGGIYTGKGNAGANDVGGYGENTWTELYSVASPAGTNWHILESCNYGQLHIAIIDGIQRYNGNVDFHLTATKIALAAWAGGAAEWDWIFVSKFVSPEPSHGSWGSEETAGIIQTWSQALNISHIFTRPICLFKLSQNVNTIHIFSQPSRFMKLTQALNTSHVYLRHRFMKLSQALRTLHTWTLPIPTFLKQWFATLQTVHVFTRPFRRIGYTQQLQPTHVFRRPVRIIRLPAIIQPTSIFNRPTRFMKLVEQLTLGHAYFMAVPGVKKTRLFLVIGDLAIQLSND